jgi:regulator of sigma E protease
VGRTDSPAYRAGLRTFDLVTEVRGRPVKTFEDLENVLRDNRGETVPVTYLRPVRFANALGAMADMAVYESGVAALTPDPGHGDLLSRTGMEPADLYVMDVVEGSAPWRADLRPGDRITEVDRVEVRTWSMFMDKLFEAPDRSHKVSWLRAGQPKSGMIQLRREDWIDEYGEHRPRFLLRASNWAPVVPEPLVDNPSFLEHAIRSAVEETYDVVRLIVVGILRLIEGRVSLSTLGGPITIYDVVGEEAQKGVSYFVWAMGVISINLGLINLLPIPILDGGHLVFFAFEAVLRRPLPLRVREIASLVGLVVLLCFMWIAFKNDVERRWEVIQGQVKELTD